MLKLPKRGCLLVLLGVLVFCAYGTTASAATANSTAVNAKIKWGFFSGALYLNKKETRKLAVASGLGASASVLLPPPFDIASGLSFGVLAAFAANADIDGNCIGVKLRLYGLPGTYLQLFSYGKNSKNGRYCK